MERLDAAEARATGWAAEKEELLKSLAAKDTMLAEEASRNAGLAAELDEARAVAEHLREEVREEAIQNTHLSFELDDVRFALSRQEEDMQILRGTNRRLTSQKNLAQDELEMALKGKAAELESVLAKQEARLKEEYLAEHDAAMSEEVGKLAANYKTQLPGIRDRAWILGWKAALKRVGVPVDSLIFRNPPKFPRSDSELRVAASPLPAFLPQAPPEVIEAPPEVSSVSEVAPAPPVVPETASAVPSKSASGIDCNMEAAAP
eukprot:TRINITY_DN14880_c0_g2_i1.p1 TRINITY_DN14880_c0_g2~~TRINITY_DN14880_c0_g2_i1.p1  ORF type:complete len:262 (+),score=52.76 TRINITY_DN14880_c0_g2_i1:218-1003(+)